MQRNPMNPFGFPYGRFEAAEKIWQNISAQPLGAGRAMIIQGLVFASLNEEGLDYILKMYGAFTGFRGMFVRDAAINRVFIIPEGVYAPSAFLQVAGQIPIFMQSIQVALAPQSPQTAPSPTNSSMSVSTPPSDASNHSSPSAKPVKIPRPPNAFILYRKSHHASIVAQNPGLHNNQISVIIGSMWNGESAEVRSRFKAQSEALKLEHLRNHPDYQYRPRKPSEKKKRMSKKKAAALADQVAAENRTKSFQIVNQYPASAHESQQPVTTLQDIHTTTFPTSRHISTNEYAQQFQFNPMDADDTNIGLPIDLSPAAAYSAAQEADMAFFAEIDESEPTYQALMKEVEEAYLAGYYDNVLSPSNETADKDYELIDYD